LRLDLPALLRAPDFDDLRDEVEELFAAERDFEAPLFFAPVRFDPLFVPPRADERELFVVLLRDADFFAPPLLAALPELLVELLLDFFAALFLDPEPPFLPPPSCLLTVAQARRSASSSDRPRLS
jgi:hypothetical protein